MSFCNSDKDACSFETSLDEADELISKTEAGIDRTLKKIESEVLHMKKSNKEDEKIKKMYKLRVLLRHRNEVNFKLPGTSMKAAASEASAKNRQEKQIQYRHNSRYALRNFRVKNYNVTSKRKMTIKKKDKMMKKELGVPIVDQNKESGINRARVTNEVTNYEKNWTKSRDTKKRKDVDEYELVNI